MGNKTPRGHTGNHKKGGIGEIPIENYIGKEVEAEIGDQKVILMVEKQLFDLTEGMLYLWGIDRKGIKTRIILNRMRP